MRLLMRLLLLAGIILLISPFLVCSLLLDHQGILVPAHVISKSEYVTVSYASWTRHLQADLQYSQPDGSGLAVLQTFVNPNIFDTLHKGDTVPLRYLLPADVPGWPGLTTMRQMRLLPYVRLAGESTWTGPTQFIAVHRTALLIALALIVTLIIWRWSRLPGFDWVLVTVFLLGITISYIGMFPRATPPPRNGVRTTSGTIQTLERWQLLFRSSHDVDSMKWLAAQPVAVVAVQFVPQGKVDPVVAVDLIDDASVPGLSEHALVPVTYEAAAPRVAYIAGATRRFPSLNLRGLLVQCLCMVTVTVFVWALARLSGQWISNLPTRARNR